MPRYPGPGLFFDQPITAEMRERAYQLTKEQLLRLEGLRKEVGIAPERMDVVYNLFAGATAEVATDAQRTRDKELRAKYGDDAY